MTTRRRRVAGVGAALAGAYAVLFHLGRSWGATVAERRVAVAGDELVPPPRLQTTHAITIEAPPTAVWPWLVQMGWGRAGWYTHRWVDVLLFPDNGPSATSLLPRFQHLAVGDRVPDGPPHTECFFTVRRVEPGRLLVLHSDSHLFGALANRDDVHMDWAWTWQLTPLPDGRTRLLQRNNGRLTPAWAGLAYVATIVPADFVMARSHLRGIRRRAERSWASAPDHTSTGARPDLQAAAMPTAESARSNGGTSATPSATGQDSRARGVGG